MQYEDYQTMGGDQYDHIKFSKAAKFLLHLWEIFITLVEKLHVCYTFGNFSVTLVENFFVTLVGNFITLVGIITLVGKFITLMGVITSKKFLLHLWVRQMWLCFIFIIQHARIRWSGGSSLLIRNIIDDDDDQFICLSLNKIIG